jgi:DNA invertase Pin-like site-specific DNA recombinase
MPVAYSYFRMSRPEQLRGDSLRRQLALSDAYAVEHNLTLDNSFQDLGVSALRGKHRTQGALSKFLALVSQGSVEKGSFLLIENLDRLSREEVSEALNLFLSIIGAGITIVTLSDGQVYSSKIIKEDYTKLLVSIIFMARAHDESSQKARRLSAAWKNKRDIARESGKRRITPNAPAWLRLSDDGSKFELMGDRALVVRRIFDESVSGIGALKVAKRLNADGIPTFGRSLGWHESYVKKILANEAVIGVMHPQTRIEGRRMPAGEPIVDYFPAAIPPDLFWRARDAQQSRLLGGGRKGDALGSLFTGIAKCAACGGPMHYLDKGAKPKGGQYLQCDHARRGAGCDFRKVFSYQPIEFAVFFSLSKADLADLQGATRDAEEAHRKNLGEIDGQLSDKNRRLGRLVDMLDVDDDAEAETVGNALKERIGILQREIAALQRARSELLKKIKVAVATGPGADAGFWDMLQSYLADLNEPKEPAELFRIRSALRHKLRGVISDITFDGNSVEIHYKNGGGGVIPLEYTVFVMPDGTFSLMINGSTDNKFASDHIVGCDYFYCVSHGKISWDSRYPDGKPDNEFPYPFTPQVLSMPVN